MSRKEYLSVRFHFDGKFVNGEQTLEYVGGEDAMSLILHGSCGIGEIHRHLRLHHSGIGNEMLHWLMPGKGLIDGLGCLSSDEACMVMLKHIPIDGVVNIYVEEPAEQLVEPNQTMDDRFTEYEIQGKDSGITFRNPDFHNEVQIIGSSVGMSTMHNEVRKKLPVYRATSSHGSEEKCDVSSDDSDYAPNDDSSDDDEAANIHQSYMQSKASVKAGKAPILDGDLKFSDAPENIEGNSSDDDDSLDEDSEGELTVKESKYPKFDTNASVPSFELGMKFNSKQEF
jgi:hypothetical protein